MALTTSERRHRIRLEAPATDRNSVGESNVVAWVRVCPPIYAKRTNMLKATAEMDLSGIGVYREMVRWDILARDIDPSWRIVELRTGRVYDIKSAGTSNDMRETAIISMLGGSVETCCETCD